MTHPLPMSSNIPEIEVWLRITHEIWLWRWDKATTKYTAEVRILQTYSVCFFSNKLPNNSATDINIWNESLWSNFAVPLIRFRRNCNDSISNFVIRCLILLVYSTLHTKTLKVLLQGFNSFNCILSGYFCISLIYCRLVKKAVNVKNKISDRTCVVFKNLSVNATFICWFSNVVTAQTLHQPMA